MFRLTFAIVSVVQASLGQKHVLDEKIASLEAITEQVQQLQKQFEAEHEIVMSQQEEINDLRNAARRLEAVTPTELLASDNSTTITTDDVIIAMDHMWLLLCGALVMFMQAGFAMLEAGTCRAKNVQNILLKNLMDVCVGTIGWWMFGWMFAYGGPLNDEGKLENGFIGTTGFGGIGFGSVDGDGNQDGGVVAGSVATTSQLNWFFQWAFCGAAATIVSGGVAERIMFGPYMLFSFVMTAFIYPLVVAWTWGYGWLAAVNDVGFMDFAGSGIVHMTGGVGALVAAAILGPRDGRFDPARAAEFDPHNLPLCVLGTFILWFGWYGFNCGSTLSMHGASTGAQAAQVAMNTTIAAATGGLVVLIIRLGMTFYMLGSPKYDLNGMCCGILAGLVSITAPCGTVECGSAFVIGLMGAIVFQAAASALKFVGVDDPLDAFAVHGACGAWGVLAAALFDWGKGFDYAHGWSGYSCVSDDNGCISGGFGQLFAANLLEIIAITAWVAAWTTAVLLPMRLAGILRAPVDLQGLGMDKAKHSPNKAYNMDTPLEPAKVHSPKKAYNMDTPF